MSLKNTNKEEMHYILALLNTTNLTFSLGQKLFKLFPDIKELFSTTCEELTKLKFTRTDISKLKNPNWSAVEKDLLWAEKLGNHIITINDAHYPQLLKEIPNPPLLLFASGDLSTLKLPQIALVGSRNPTPNGTDTAFAFAKDLAYLGFVITSGFASGIDAASHNGALESSGKTVAVMGTGLNKLYPKHHTALAEKILAAGGLLLSEFPLDASGQTWHFPLRNRIISGLSIGTVVIEATIRSGSLITARLASEQGREVFAVPGSINNPLARGCHYLIRQGAKLVEETQDITEELRGFSNLARIPTKKNKNIKNKNKLARMHRMLLDCIGFEVTTTDVLAARTNLPINTINALLLDLEMDELIKSQKGGYIKISIK